MRDNVSLGQFVNASQDETFTMARNFLESRGAKIITLSPPALLKGEVGSWTSMEFDHEKARVQIRITKRNGASFVNVIFDFGQVFIMGLLVAIIGSCVLYGYLVAISMGSFSSVDLAQVNKIALFPIVAYLATVLSLAAYAVSTTKSRFLQDFHDSLAALSARSLSFEK